MPTSSSPRATSPLPASSGVAQQQEAWITHRLTVGGLSPATSLLDQEWLLANGTGAYAMGTAAGMNTRRYHGLFIAATNPPVGRILALNQMYETLTLRSETAGDGTPASPQSLDLSSLIFTNEQGHWVFAPSGHTLLRRFSRGLSVNWTYSWGRVQVERQLHLHWKEQSATLRYLLTLTPSDSSSAPAHKSLPATLRLAPMLTLRDFHAMTHRGIVPRLRVEKAAGGVTVRCDQLSVSFGSGGRWTAWDESWWNNVFYPADAERGQECREDYQVPGCFEVDVDLAAPGGAEVLLTVALGDRVADTEAWRSGDRLRHLQTIEKHLTALPVEPECRKALVVAADDFIVDRMVKGRELATVMAGYPWFADWGRDTFIALPGLLLCTGRFEDARATLRAFAEAVKDGLVPNRFDDYDSSSAHYNTVDASLWFIRAAMEYLDASDDPDAWDDFLGDACMKIMEAYIRGTSYGIRMAGDGLITAGDRGTQLTWMDAAAEGTVFTPRPGKAVEINALWFHALLGLSRRLESSNRQVATHYAKLADRIRRSFVKVFWNEDRRCLIDHVWTDEQGQEHVDAALRPNQILAVSLPDSPLPRTKQVQVVETVTAGLLTPCGLRTLPEGDPNYHPRYTGGAFQRDKAYHQGTIWPWLIGPYAEAVLRAGDFSAKARQDARAAIAPLLDTLMGSGLGQLHEIHEAQPPHRPVGAIAQAWSVSEVLRVLRLLES